MQPAYTVTAMQNSSISGRFRFIRVPEIRIFEGAEPRDCESFPLKPGFR